MRPGGHLARWLATAKAGRCPCGRRLTHGHKRLCARAECRREYQRLYARDRTHSSLRAVVGQQAVPDSPRRVTLLLECGHAQEAPLSRGGTTQRRHCRTCAPPPGA